MMAAATRPCSPPIPSHVPRFTLHVLAINSHEGIEERVGFLVEKREKAEKESFFMKKVAIWVLG